MFYLWPCGSKQFLPPILLTMVLLICVILFIHWVLGVGKSSPEVTFLSSAPPPRNHLVLIFYARHPRGDALWWYGMPQLSCVWVKSCQCPCVTLFHSGCDTTRISVWGASSGEWAPHQWGPLMFKKSGKYALILSRPLFVKLRRNRNTSFTCPFLLD